jgi:hypothetical protein
MIEFIARFSFRSRSVEMEAETLRLDNRATFKVCGHQCREIDLTAPLGIAFLIGTVVTLARFSTWSKS